MLFRSHEFDHGLVGIEETALCVKFHNRIGIFIGHCGEALQVVLKPDLVTEIVKADHRVEMRSRDQRDAFVVDGEGSAVAVLDHHLWDPYRLACAKDRIDRTIVVMQIGVSSLTSKQLVKGFREDCLLAPPKNSHALLVQMYNLSIGINDADPDWERIQNAVWGHMIDCRPDRECWCVTMHEFAVEVMILRALSVSLPGNLRARSPTLYCKWFGGWHILGRSQCRVGGIYGPHTNIRRFS